MPLPIHLLVGLANPGLEYAHTRHNAGAWLIEELARRTQTVLRYEAKYHGLYGATHLHAQSCRLLIPTTYMNLSGQAVNACMNYHKLTPETILIAHDDIDLPVGTVRLKWDGGDGGHNGLKDIIRHLSTKQFYRLRIGIGRPAPGSKQEVVDYVLEKPSQTDRQQINLALQKAQEVLPLILSGDIARAMQELHTANESRGE